MKVTLSWSARTDPAFCMALRTLRESCSRTPEAGNTPVTPGAPPVKPPSKTRLSDLKGGSGPVKKFEPPTPKVSRLKKGKVLTPAEKAAFLASRPDLKS